MNREEMIARSGGSHLEQLFSAALWDAGWRHCEDPDEAEAEVGPVAIAWINVACAGDRCVGVPQVRVDVGGSAHIVDFVFFTLGRERVVVELDGHAYHERTPEQASRDRAADRALQIDGAIVLRFTHLELTRYMPACLADLGEAIQTQIARFELELAAHSSPRRHRVRVSTRA